MTDTGSLSLDGKEEKSPLPLLHHPRTCLETLTSPISPHKKLPIRCAALCLQVCRGQSCIKGLKGAMMTPALLESPPASFPWRKDGDGGPATSEVRVRLEGGPRGGPVPAMSQETASCYRSCLSTVRQLGVVLAA